MDQTDKFWEEQEEEIKQAIKKLAARKKPWPTCGTPAIRKANQKKSKPKD